MSLLSSIESGLDKAVSFIVKVFTKTAEVVTVIQKVGPSTLAAILAVFYDVSKFLITESANVAAATADVKTLNFTAALSDVFTPATQTILMQLITDFKAAETQVVADFSDLGIAVSSPKPSA